jgi:bacterioferritin-associated ferredoxin
MYVCLCNGYRDAEIREVAESGVRCVREVYFTLGNGPCCGTCLGHAQGIVDSVHGGIAETAAEETADDMAGRAGEPLLMAAE